MSPDQHFQAIFDDANYANENDAEPTSLDSLGLTIVYLIQALHAAFAPNKPALLPDSQARVLTKLAKSAEDWCLLLGAGHTPSPELMHTLQNVAEPGLPADLAPPAEPAHATPWLRQIRKLLHRRATAHLCAATTRLALHPDQAKSTDADMRMLALIQRLNPVPAMERHTKGRHKAKLNRAATEHGTQDFSAELPGRSDRATDGTHDDVRSVLRRAADAVRALQNASPVESSKAPQNASRGSKPRTHPNPSKQYKSRRPVQPK